MQPGHSHKTGRTGQRNRSHRREKGGQTIGHSIQQATPSQGGTVASPRRSEHLGGRCHRGYQIGQQDQGDQQRGERHSWIQFRVSPSEHLRKLKPATRRRGRGCAAEKDKQGPTDQDADQNGVVLHPTAPPHRDTDHQSQNAK